MLQTLDKLLILCHYYVMTSTNTQFAVLFDDGAHSIEIDTFDLLRDARDEFKHQVSIHDGSYGEFELVQYDACGDYVDTIQYHCFASN